MSTHYDNQAEQLTVTCDACGFEDEFRGNFKGCVEQMKDHGWHLSQNEGGEWFHYCSDACYEK